MFLIVGAHEVMYIHAVLWGAADWCSSWSEASSAWCYLVTPSQRWACCTSLEKIGSFHLKFLTYLLFHTLFPHFSSLAPHLFIQSRLSWQIDSADSLRTPSESLLHAQHLSLSSMCLVKKENLSDTQKSKMTKLITTMSLKNLQIFPLYLKSYTSWRTPVQ